MDARRKWPNSSVIGRIRGRCDQSLPCLVDFASDWDKFAQSWSTWLQSWQNPRDATDGVAAIKGASPQLVGSPLPFEATPVAGAHGLNATPKVAAHRRVATTHDFDRLVDSTSFSSRCGVNLAPILGRSGKSMPVCGESWWWTSTRTQNAMARRQAALTGLPLGATRARNSARPSLASSRGRGTPAASSRYPLRR